MQFVHTHLFVILCSVTVQAIQLKLPLCLYNLTVVYTGESHGRSDLQQGNGFSVLPHESSRPESARDQDEENDGFFHRHNGLFPGERTRTNVCLLHTTQQSGCSRVPSFRRHCTSHVPRHFPSESLAIFSSISVVRHHEPHRYDGDPESPELVGLSSRLFSRRPLVPCWVNRHPRSRCLHRQRSKNHSDELFRSGRLFGCGDQTDG